MANDVISYIPSIFFLISSNKNLCFYFPCDFYKTFWVTLSSNLALSYPYIKIVDAHHIITNYIE